LIRPEIPIEVPVYRDSTGKMPVLQKRGSPAWNLRPRCIAAFALAGYDFRVNDSPALSRYSGSLEMHLTEILKPQNILIPMQSSTKNEAIGELVSLLAKNGEIQDAKAVLSSVLERETTRTTGIGNGLAIPHGKCTGTNQLVMAIGKLATPIDFQSIDGRPVSLIWLLTSPPDKTGPHIHALARISRLMTIDKFRQALAVAKTPQEIYDVIVAQEKSL
jgi:fructose-specific phosphotransferase system IIA component